jgi:Sulfotransferase domain
MSEPTGRLPASGVVGSVRDDADSARLASTGTLADDARERSLPNFFIVGHPKSGTTALSLMLRNHPQLYIPVKEPRFFAPELASRLQQANSRTRPKTLDAYVSLFAGAAPGQLVGDATPAYLRSHDAARRIAEVRPDARIVAILREPASFLRSFHLQSVHNHVETEKDFGRAIALEPLRRQGKRIPLLSQSPRTLLYSEHVKYVEQLRRYHGAFPREQVMVLIYDDFRRDNEATVRRVLRFLEVDDAGPLQTIRTQPLPAVRSQLLHQLMRVVAISHRNPGAAGPLSQVVHRITPREVRSERLRALWRRTVYGDPPTADPELMLELRRRFKPQVEAASEYLERDLISLWGYDQLD